METKRGIVGIGQITILVRIPELSEHEVDILVLRILKINGVKYVMTDYRTLTIGVEDWWLTQIPDLKREILHRAVTYLNSLPAPTR